MLVELHVLLKLFTLQRSPSASGHYRCSMVLRCCSLGHCFLCQTCTPSCVPKPQSVGCMHMRFQLGQDTHLSIPHSMSSQPNIDWLLKMILIVMGYKVQCCCSRTTDPSFTACLSNCAGMDCRLQLEACEGSGTRPAHTVQPCSQGGEV